MSNTTPPPNIPFYKFAKSFADYKKQHLSKIYTYENESRDVTYFYFFRRNRSQHYDKHQLKTLYDQYSKNERELKEEFKEIYLKLKNGI